ncbi:hypothetical protein EPI10_003856 [Gossypium australe]|uniref:Uncharacterized protein n=1 Tax=Gossypium australe TaxID=47621 RepID=A0A5B6ULU7_9ROSI|nr:hypothetical protein EPI10_003856 [Gossypium australe]
MIICLRKKHKNGHIIILVSRKSKKEKEENLELGIRHFQAQIKVVKATKGSGPSRIVITLLKLILVPFENCVV